MKDASRIPAKYCRSCWVTGAHTARRHYCAGACATHAKQTSGGGQGCGCSTGVEKPTAIEVQAMKVGELKGEFGAALGDGS